MPIGEDENGTHLIGCTVVGITTPNSSSSELRHMKSISESILEDMLEYYADDPDMVKKRGVQEKDENGNLVRDAKGNVVWLPVPEDLLKQDHLNRMDHVKGAFLTHQGGKEDGDLPVHEFNCRLFKLDKRQLSVSIGEWQAGYQHANLSQSDMVATPTYLYSIAPELQPDGTSALKIRFKVMWELSLNHGELPSGGSGNTPPRIRRTSAFAKRMANAQKNTGT